MMNSMMLAQDTLSAQALDTLAAVQRSAADSVYLEILETANQQLGLWANPYGLMVAALTVVFTVLGIMVLTERSSKYSSMTD